MSKGHIRCSKCEKSLSGPVCSCGHTKCYIYLYWKGKEYKFRKYKEDGLSLNHERATVQLSNVRSEIYGKIFNPLDWIDSKIAERKFKSKINEWLAVKQKEVKDGELAPETYRKYFNTSLKYFLPAFESFDVRDIDKEQISRFKNILSGSIKYRRDILGILHAFLKWLYEEGVIKTVPSLPKIKGDDTVIRVSVDYEDQIEALKKLPIRYRDSIEFAMETGLRPGELCALKVKDINYGKRYALIQRTWSGKHLKETTKGRSKKAIPLSTRAMEIASKSIAGKFPESFVFEFRPRTLQNMWTKHSGLKTSLYEATRHSFCTQIVETGVNTLQAKELMRHADIRSTEKYFHASITKLRDVIEKRGKVISVVPSEILPGKVGKP